MDGVWVRTAGVWERAGAGVCVRPTTEGERTGTVEWDRPCDTEGVAVREGDA